MDERYIGREQTLVKHVVLAGYLQRFAHIVGSCWDSITYVDCFSGPWNVRSDDLGDSSFAIAVRELRMARDTWRQRGREVRIRCLFLERDTQAWTRLKRFADSVDDAEIRTLNAELEGSIEAIVQFVRDGGPKTFPFVFVDPAGWTGFALDTIAPLLRLEPGEVLVNFMTGHIRRFLESPDGETQESLARLFGSAGFRETIRGLSGQDREDAAVGEYAESLRRVGGFEYACAAIVLHPELRRTHFHLVYATRSPKGIEVFKEAEKRAMAVMELVRASAGQRKRQKATGQLELLPAPDLHDSNHYDALRSRYLNRARTQVQGELERRRRVSYDDAWLWALHSPMTWESDLKGWIRQWQAQGQLKIEGLAPGQRVPRRGRGHTLVWRDE